MFTDREYQLLAILLSFDHWISGKRLSLMLNISERTLQYEISTVNKTVKYYFSINNAITSNNRLGYRIGCNPALLKHKLAETSQNYVQSDFDNKSKILLLLLFQKDFISISAISEKLYLAKSSVVTNLDKIKVVLSNQSDINLTINKTKGLLLEATELTKRKLIVSIMVQSNCNNLNSFLNIHFNCNYLAQRIQAIIASIIVPIEFIIEGSQLSTLARVIAVSMLRTNEGYLLPTDEKNEFTDITTAIRNKVSDELQYELNSSELQMLENAIRDTNVIGTTKVAYEDTDNVLLLFVEKVKADLHIPIAFDDGNLKRTSEYLHKMLYRISSNNEVNAVKNNLPQVRYPLAAHLIKTYLSQAIETEISDDEVNMLIPYISLSIANIKQKINVYIVSNKPIGSIYHFRVSLQSEYQSLIQKIRVFPTYLYNAKFKHFDEDAVFFTTEPLLSFENSNLIYIDSSEDDVQRELISNAIISKMQSVKKDKITSFISNKLKALELSWEKPTIELLFQQFNINKNNTSITHYSDRLLIIENGMEDEQNISIHLQNDMDYSGEKIHTIFYFYINQKTDFNILSESIKELMTSHTG